MQQTDRAIGVVNSLETVDSELVPPSVRGSATSVERIQFRGGDPLPAYLDPVAAETPRLRRAIQAFADLRRPVFLRLSSNRLVRDVLVPQVGRVVDFAESLDGTIIVGFDTTPRTCLLDSSTAEYSEMSSTLRMSRDTRVPVAVTTGHWQVGILDVRVAPGEWQLSTPGFFTSAQSVGEVLKHVTPVSEGMAIECYRTCERMSCSIPVTDPRCVPFLLVEDGCHARAHKIYKVLHECGLTAGKVWAFGQLDIHTVNHPDCHICFSWHVAPFLRASDLARTEIYIIDPAFSSEPKTLPDWLRMLSNPRARIEFTEGTIFQLSADGYRREEGAGSRPGTTETDDYLDIYRKDLELLPQPPPFRQCLPPWSGIDVQTLDHSPGDGPL